MNMCMYVRMYVCICTYMNIFTYVGLYCTCSNKYIYIYTYSENINMYVHTERTGPKSEASLPIGGSVSRAWGR